MSNNVVLEDVQSSDIDTCKIYDGAQVRYANLGKHVVIGEDAWLTRCELGDYVQINRRNQIDDVTMGSRTFTGANTILRHAEIGKFTSISWNVSLGGGGRHHYDRLALHPFAQLRQFGVVEENEPTAFPRTTFGNDVWIGMDVTIIAGVKIGDGAVIGAGSVVTKDVPPYSIVVGAPARVHKYRFNDATIERLLQWKWWDWPEEILKENISIFQHTFQEADLKKMQAIFEERIQK